MRGEEQQENHMTTDCQENNSPKKQESKCANHSCLKLANKKDLLTILLDKAHLNIVICQWGANHDILR